jgi:hypothetical protein
MKILIFILKLILYKQTIKSKLRKKLQENLTTYSVTYFFTNKTLEIKFIKVRYSYIAA